MLTFMEFLARQRFFNEDVENPIWLFNKEYIELPVIHNQVLPDNEDKDLKHFVHDYLQNFQIQAKEIENKELKYDEDMNHKVADMYATLSFGMVPRKDNFMFCYDNNTSIMFQPKDMSENVVEMILDHILTETSKFKGNCINVNPLSKTQRVIAYEITLHINNMKHYYKDYPSHKANIYFKIDFRNNENGWHKSDSPARFYLNDNQKKIRIPKDLKNNKICGISLHPKY